MRKYKHLLPFLISAVAVLLIIGSFLLPSIRNRLSGTRPVPPSSDPPIIQALKKHCTITGWSEVQINHKPYWGIGNLDVDPYIDGGAANTFPSSFGLDDGGSLSQDGTLLIMFIDYFNPSTKILEIVNLNTGTVTDLIDTFHLPAYLDKGDGTAGRHTIRTAFWHPVDPNIIFTDIYRLDLSTTRKQNMLHSDNLSFGQPFPDGKWIPVFAWRTNSTYLQSLTKPRNSRKVNWPMGYITISPDGSIVQGWSLTSAGTFIVFYDIATQRQLGKVNTIFLDKTISWNIQLLGITRWLPNSSELLVAGVPLRHWKRRGIWKVSTSGVITHIADDATLIASSDNGQHFLFNVGKKYYLVHVK